MLIRMYEFWPASFPAKGGGKLRDIGCGGVGESLTVKSIGPHTHYDISVQTSVQLMEQ